MRLINITIDTTDFMLKACIVMLAILIGVPWWFYVLFIFACFGITLEF